MFQIVEVYPSPLGAVGRKVLMPVRRRHAEALLPSLTPEAPANVTACKLAGNRRLGHVAPVCGLTHSWPGPFCEQRIVLVDGEFVGVGEQRLDRGERCCRR